MELRIASCNLLSCYIECALLFKNVRSCRLWSIIIIKIIMMIMWGCLVCGFLTFTSVGSADVVCSVCGCVWIFSFRCEWDWSVDCSAAGTKHSNHLREKSEMWHNAFYKHHSRYHHQTSHVQNDIFFAPQQFKGWWLAEMWMCLVGFLQVLLCAAEDFNSVLNLLH